MGTTSHNQPSPVLMRISQAKPDLAWRGRREVAARPVRRDGIIVAVVVRGSHPAGDGGQAARPAETHEARDAVASDVAARGAEHGVAPWRAVAAGTPRVDPPDLPEEGSVLDPARGLKRLSWSISATNSRVKSSGARPAETTTRSLAQRALTPSAIGRQTAAIPLIPRVEIACRGISAS